MLITCKIFEDSTHVGYLSFSENVHPFTKEIIINYNITNSCAVIVFANIGLNILPIVAVPLTFNKVK
jgi:hypothetical protein